MEVRVFDEGVQKRLAFARAVGEVEEGAVGVHPLVAVVVDGRNPFSLDEVGAVREHEPSRGPPRAPRQRHSIADMPARRGVCSPARLLVDVSQDEGPPGIVGVERMELQHWAEDCWDVFGSADRPRPFSRPASPPSLDKDRGGGCITAWSHTRGSTLCGRASGCASIGGSHR